MYINLRGEQWPVLNVSFIEIINSPIPRDYFACFWATFVTIDQPKSASGILLELRKLGSHFLNLIVL